MMYHIAILQYLQICMRDWGTVLLDLINICFCFVLRRSANVKLPDNPNQQCVHYSAGVDKNNIKSNTNPNDINEDVYNHLGDVLPGQTYLMDCIYDVCM
jgi:hypothetical protein